MGQCICFEMGATGANQRHTLCRAHDHELKRHPVGGVVCSCGWGPTYNYTAEAQAAEWRAHQREVGV